MTRRWRSILLAFAVVIAVVLGIAVWAWCYPTRMPSWVQGICQVVRLERWARARNGPISFYGRIVDQNNIAIAGVRISASVSVSDGFERGRMEKVEVITDPNGLFAVTNEWGSDLAFDKIEKEGYSVAFGRSGFSFDHSPSNRANLYVPDASKPEVFRMWRKGVPQPLLYFRRRIDVVPDGRIYSVKLVEDTVQEGKVADSDLWISVTRPDAAKRIEPSDWSYQIEVNRGGIIMTNDEYLNLAPDGGYQQKFAYASRDNNKNKIDPRRNFYLRCRDGQLYGSGKVNVSPYIGDGSCVYLELNMNPRGSTNLEPDPKKTRNVWD